MTQTPISVESEDDTTYLTLESGVGVVDLVEIVVEGLLAVVTVKVTVGVVMVVDVADKLLVVRTVTVTVVVDLVVIVAEE